LQIDLQDIRERPAVRGAAGLSGIERAVAWLIPDPVAPGKFHCVMIRYVYLINLTLVTGGEREIKVYRCGMRVFVRFRVGSPERKQVKPRIF
jgi:hypothetical protein